MKHIELRALIHTDVRFRNLVVYPEAWTKRKSFSLYKNTPRPCSAFFFICTDITSVFLSDSGESVTARRGDVLYIPQNTMYHARIGGTPSGQLDTYTVNFELLDETGEPLNLSDRITVLTHSGDDRFTLRTASLARAVRQIDGSRSLLKINAEFYSLLDAIVTAENDRSDKYYPIRIGAEALRSEWNRNERIEKYAEMCGVSNTYFYRCFREWSGRSPVEYRNLLRLSNAETMLRYTDMRVSEISEAIGFEDPFYFCRIFSARYGASPQKYRKIFRAEEK